MADIEPLPKPDPFSYCSADGPDGGLRGITMANLAGLLEVVRWRLDEADAVDRDASQGSRGSVSGYRGLQRMCRLRVPRGPCCWDLSNADSTAKCRHAFIACSSS